MKTKDALVVRGAGKTGKQDPAAGLLGKGQEFREDRMTDQDRDTARGQKEKADVSRETGSEGQRLKAGEAEP